MILLPLHQFSRCFAEVSDFQKMREICFRFKLFPLLTCAVFSPAWRNVIAVTGWIAKEWLKS